MKNCFGDEAGEYGMSACDPKNAIMYNREWCFARTIGLRVCLGDEVIASCGLLSSLQTLEKQADSPLMSDLLLLGSGDVLSLQSEDATAIEAAASKNNDTPVTEFALSDEKFSKYLAQGSSNMTVSAFHAKVDEMVSQALSETTDGGLFDTDVSHQQAMSEYQNDSNGRKLFVVQTVSLVCTAIFAAVGKVVAGINQASQKRESFTKTAVEMCATRLTGYGCVIVFNGAGHHVSGKYETSTTSIDGKFDYIMYAAKESDPFIFHLTGDGGYINWAFKGPLRSEGKFVGTEPLFRGLRVYEHTNFGGWSKYLIPAEKGYNFAYSTPLNPKIPGYRELILNDAISSFKLDAGVCALAYENEDLVGKTYGGCNLGTYAGTVEVADVGVHGGNDKISAIVVWNPNNM